MISRVTANLKLCINKFSQNTIKTTFLYVPSRAFLLILSISSSSEKLKSRSSESMLRISWDLSRETSREESREAPRFFASLGILLRKG